VLLELDLPVQLHESLLDYFSWQRFHSILAVRALCNVGPAFQNAGTGLRHHSTCRPRFWNHSGELHIRQETTRWWAQRNFVSSGVGVANGHYFDV
jgi:hypothetical protein